jgi:hypothetical protein
VEPPPMCLDRDGEDGERQDPTDGADQRTPSDDRPPGRATRPPMTMTTIMAAPPTITSTLALSIDEA